MKIALLGYGKEGQAAEQYFKPRVDEIKIFDKFTDAEIDNFPLDQYDLVFRTPSVRPRFKKNWTSLTRYFFDNCPCPIIGVTGTKGKGTTCSFIHSILQSIGKTVHLVGNIGNPAISALDKISPDDFVVFEMSSFQLWDLEKSPHIAVVLRIEPDHLDIHRDFDEYVMAKANIVKYQTEQDCCIFYNNNPDSRRIADLTKAKKYSYPIEETPKIRNLLDHISIPGPHNRENAEAALLTVACALDLSLDDFITKYNSEIIEGLASFRGLPHRLELVRELNGIKFYDDNYSATYPSLEVAVKTFKDQKMVLIAGGKDRRLGAQNLKNLQKVIFGSPNIQKTLLIGEMAPQIAQNMPKEKYEICFSLEEAMSRVSELIKNDGTEVVLMSPGAPSFDMFKNFTDRGEQFKKLVWELK